MRHRSLLFETSTAQSERNVAS